MHVFYGSDRMPNLVIKPSLSKRYCLQLQASTRTMYINITHWTHPAMIHKWTPEKRQCATFMPVSSLTSIYKPKELKAASVHKSVMTHAGNVFVPHYFNLWFIDPKMNELSGFMVEHAPVKFGDPSCIGFWGTVWTNSRQTDKQTLPTQLPSA